MKKNQILKIFAIWLTVIVLPISIAFSQNSQSQLAQKIMLENHLRTQAESALKHALGKERFFVNVNAELIITPAQRSQQIWEPGKEAKDTNISRFGSLNENLPTGTLPGSHICWDRWAGVIINSAFTFTKNRSLPNACLKADSA